MKNNYNLKVYMCLRLCMHKHVDLITNPFKYKSETYQVFMSLKKIVMNTKCNS
jgi:hypothetical protein